MFTLCMLTHGLPVNLLFSDACPSQNISLIAGINITISWRKTTIAQQVNRPCPCQNQTRQFESVITRRCGGSYSQGARWEDMDYTRCGFTERIIKICEALQVRNTLLCIVIGTYIPYLNQRPPKVLAKVLVNVTSSPATLAASEVSVAAVVIDELTTTAAKDPEVGPRITIILLVYMNY